MLFKHFKKNIHNHNIKIEMKYFHFLSVKINTFKKNKKIISPHIIKN